MTVREHQASVRAKRKKRIRRLVIAYALRSAIILLLVLMEDCVIPNCFLQNTIQRGIFPERPVKSCKIRRFAIDKPLSHVVSYNTPSWERQLNRLY